MFDSQSCYVFWRKRKEMFSTTALSAGSQATLSSSSFASQRAASCSFSVRLARCFVLFQRQAATLDVTPVAMHLQVKLRIIPLHRLHQTLHNDTRFELFLDFSFKRLLRRFPWFHLSPWKLPAILEVPISPLRREDTSFVIMYDCCYNFYLFHSSAAFSTLSSSSCFR